MIRMSQWMLAGLALALVLGLTTPALAADDSKDRGTTSAESIQGQVQKVDADRQCLTLKDKLGGEWSFHIGPNAKVRLNGNESQIRDLKQGDTVTVTFHRMARDVNAGQQAQAAQAACGQVKQIQADQNQLTLEDPYGKQWTFRLGQNAQICRDNQARQLTDLQNGDHVVIFYNRQGENLMAQNIRCQPQGQAAEGTHGQVQNVAADQQQLTLRDAQGKDRTFRLSQNARVEVGGKESKLADLKQGDEVNVVYRMVAQEIRSERQ